MPTVRFTNSRVDLVVELIIEDKAAGSSGQYTQQEIAAGGYYDHLADDNAGNPGTGRLKWWTVAEGHSGDPEVERDVVDTDPPIAGGTAQPIAVSAGTPV